MKKLKMIAIFLLSVCFIKISVDIENVKAASKELNAGISKSCIVMYPNMAKEIKFQNASSKIKWVTSNGKIAEILGSRGKRHQTVIFRSHSKTGDCRIEAKVNGKTYSCKIIVKSDSHISKSQFIKATKTSKKFDVSVRLYNKTKEKMMYAPFKVEKFAGSTWKELSLEGNLRPVAKVPPESEKKRTFALARGKRVNQFTKGVYRLYFIIYTGQKKSAQWMLFTIN